MINAILNGLLSFASELVILMLRPIDQFIDQNIPSLSTAINNVGALFDLISQGLGWAIDSFCLPSFAVTFLVITFSFRLSLRLAVKGVKLALNWWEKIVP